MSFVEARDKWAAMNHAERKELIEKVHGDVAVAVDDWAALPPQAHTAIMAVLFPQEAADKTEAAEKTGGDDDGETHTRRGRR